MRSIERRLLAWVLGALTVGALGLVLVAYFVTLDEMNEVFDDNLKQVALAVASYHNGRAASAPAPLSPSQLPKLPTHYDQEGDFDFVTATWTASGVRTFTSDPSIDIPFDPHTGLRRVRTQQGHWYVYTIVTSAGVAQAAQRNASRRALALESTSKMCLPLLALVPLIGGLLVFALRRGLRPLDVATESVALRSAMSLEPIPLAGMPREIHPLIDSINDLMQRLSIAFVTQRRFVADAAHELRTPATALRLQLQLLERADNAPTRQAAMAELKAGIDRAQHLIEQLLLLSRVEPDAPMQIREAVDLGDLVRQVVGALSVTAEHKRIDLGAAVPAGAAAGSLVIDGNRHQLVVLLNNLVGNALRYTPAGGVVDVKVSRDDGALALRVIDNGPGIDPDERERVFDRFYRGRNVGAGDASDGDHDTGSGLGLAIVKAIADQHDAEVTLHAAPAGRGLEARVVFSHSPNRA